MSAVPNLNRAITDEEPSGFGAPIQVGNSQLVGCFRCLMEGNIEHPEVIYHYAGTTYCMDHLYAQLSTQGQQQ